MKRRTYVNILLIAMMIASVFLYTSCQKRDDTGLDRSKGVVDEGEKFSSEEKLADLKVDVVEGDDYQSLNVEIEDFELLDLEGNKVKLSDYKDKIVLLNFWATWCPPCKAEMPYMQQIHDQYEDVAILAVNSTSTELRGSTDSNKAKNKVVEFINQEGYTFPILLDADDEVITTYNAIFPIMGIPTTFIIDKTGTIRYVRPGPFIDRQHIEQFIKLAQE